MSSDPTRSPAAPCYEPLWSVREAAAYLGMSLDWVYRAAEAGELPRERTGVFVGMGVDAEVARYGARWRAADWSG